MKTASKSASHSKFVVARWWLAALTVCALVAVLLVAAPAHAQDDDDDDGVGEFETGEVVVKINPKHVPPATIEQINAEYGTTTKETFLASSKIYLLDTNGRPADTLAETMAGDARLLYAEPNYTTESPEGNPYRYAGRTDYRPDPTSTATEYSSTQYAIGALRLKQAQQVEDGSGATVAVLDTGIQVSHPELAGSTVAGYDFVDDDTNPADARNNLDDDGDGEVDEMVGHGTHVAGAVHLTAPGAKIMPMRVLDSDGTGNIFLIAEAIQRSVTGGADVVNMSLGSSTESDLLEDILEDIAEPGTDDDDAPSIENVPPEGVVVVGSAGNNNGEVENYPAADEGVLAVASVDENEKRSEFSNFGQWVDISAPGEEIHSLFPTSRYAAWDGTSMAAPFIAGQAALLRGQNPNLPATSGDDDDPIRPSVESKIKTTARNIDAKNPSFAGKLGAGHADVAASLGSENVVVANAAPTISAMTPEPGARTSDRTPRISATVRDSDSKLAKSNIRLLVNGTNRTAFTYNASTGQLVFDSPRLPFGKANVQVVAKDPQGKQASRAWSFSVVR